MLKQGGMRERVWSVFPRGGSHPAKLAWALKEHLERQGFGVERVARTEWGFRLELRGAEILLAEHAVEPGVLELRVRPRGRLFTPGTRARVDKLSGAVWGFLTEHPALRVEEVSA